MKHSAYVKAKRVFEYKEDQEPTKHVPAPAPVDGYYRSLAEKIAQHRLYIKNSVVECLKNSFRHAPSMWHVDRCFPYSKLGKLYIDEPHFDQDYKESLRKQEVMKNAGMKLVILKQNSTYEDAMNQLAELDQCLGQPQP